VLFLFDSVFSDFSALMPLIGQKEGHPAYKKFRFKTPWDVGQCK